MNTETSSFPTKEGEVVKIYSPPQLIEYGNIQQLTLAAGNNNKAMADGGPSNMDKTY